MEGPPRYQLLNREDDEEILASIEEKDETAWNARESEIIPANTKSFVICLTIVLLSLSANILLVMDNARLRIAQRLDRTRFSGLTFNSSMTYHASTKFWSLNGTESEMDAAWDSIDTGPMAVALDDRFAKRVGLPPTVRFPWDTERSVYYLKGVHDLHCLKLIRKAIVDKHNNSSQTYNLNHIYHCLDGLRQDIMCLADDTPMPAAAAHHVGDGQVRQCRDWNQMIAWATEPERHACYQWDDYREATNTLELFGHCPSNSPYKAFQQAYFEYHGHKDPYELKEHPEPVDIF